MMNYRYFFLIIASSLLIGCAAKLPLVVNGAFPTTKPAFDKYYEGDTLSREKTSMLVGANAADQADIYIIKVDGVTKSQTASLVGGSKAAILLPGMHDVVIQLHDRGRITMPLTLKGIKLEAGAGYLINFKLNYPEKFEYISGNDHLKITIMVSNLDSKAIIYRKEFNGWGKEI